MRGLGLALLFMLVCTVSAALALPKEGPAAACDNSGAKDTEMRSHHCGCERTAKDHCDPEGVKSPKAACKTYCKPDNCDCGGPCVPS